MCICVVATTVYAISLHDIMECWNVRVRLKYEEILTPAPVVIALENVSLASVVSFYLLFFTCSYSHASLGENFAYKCKVLTGSW